MTMKAGTWIEVHIESTAEGADLVAAAVTPLTGGVEIRDAGTLLKAEVDRGIVVALCAPEAVADLLAEVDETLAVARAAGARVDPVTVRQRESHEDEWRDVWKQFFRATRIGRRFMVRPSWDPGEVEFPDHVIDLDPGRAFGTGAHPTTRLVIGLAEAVFDQGVPVHHYLDLGCGSGILAIAAARLWPAARGLAVDNDPEATACTGENLERNRVATVTVQTGLLADVSGTFDLIVANIQADVLHDLATALRARLAEGGRLVLSGLLSGDVAPLWPVYQAAGFVLQTQVDDGEWSALLLAA